MSDIVDFQGKQDSKGELEKNIIMHMDAKFGLLLCAILDIDFKVQNEIIDDILSELRPYFILLKNYGEIEGIKGWMKYLEQITQSYNRHKQQELLELISQLKTLIGIENTQRGVKDKVVDALSEKSSH